MSKLLESLWFWLITLRSQVQILSPQPNYRLITNTWNPTKALMYDPRRNESTPSQRLTSPPEKWGFLRSRHLQQGRRIRHGRNHRASLAYDSAIPLRRR